MVSHFGRRFKEENKDINRNIKLIAVNTDLQSIKYNGW